MSDFINKIKENKEFHFDQLIFFACIIDMFFFPYVWFISIPYTLPFLFIWFLRRFKSINRNDSYKKEFHLFQLFFVLLLFSTVYSFILNPGYIYKNTVFLIIYTMLFLNYFMYLYYVDQYKCSIKLILILFVVFVLILAIIYNISKGSYHNLMLFWNNRSGISINENLYDNYVGYRFAFIWMDPNDVAYTMNAVVLYLWCNEKTGLFTKVFSLLALLYILFSCMSNGGFISFTVGFGLYIVIQIFYLFRGNSMKKYKITPVNIFLVLLTFIVLLYVIPHIPEYLKSSVVMESLDRIQKNSGASRIEIWQTVLNNVNFFKYILIGSGGVTLVDGMAFPPHNGHFYLILGYGFVAYFIFMYIVFRKRRITSFKKYIWIAPIIFGFTINVLLGEIKMMSIIMLLIACTSSKKYLENN